MKRLIDEYELRGEETADVPPDFPWLAVSIIEQTRLLVRVCPAMPNLERAQLVQAIQGILEK